MQRVGPLLAQSKHRNQLVPDSFLTQCEPRHVGLPVGQSKFWVYYFFMI